MLLKPSLITWLMFYHIAPSVATSDSLLQGKIYKSWQKGGVTNHLLHKYQCPDLNQIPEEWGDDDYEIPDGDAKVYELDDTLRPLDSLGSESNSPSIDQSVSDTLCTVSPVASFSHHQENQLAHTGQNTDHDQNPASDLILIHQPSRTNSESSLFNLFEDDISLKKGTSVVSELCEGMEPDKLGLEESTSDTNTSIGCVENLKNDKSLIISKENIKESSANHQTQQNQGKMGKQAYHNVMDNSESLPVDLDKRINLKRKEESVLENLKCKEPHLDGTTWKNNHSSQPSTRSKSTQDVYSEPENLNEHKGRTSWFMSPASLRLPIIPEAQLGEWKIKSNKECFKDMGKFWSKKDVKLRSFLSTQFPNEPIDYNSVTFLVFQKLLFPMFIDKVAFIHPLIKEPFKFTSLSSMLVSASNYFQVWCTKEVEKLIKYLDDHVKHKGEETLTFENRMRLCKNTISSVLYKSEFGYEETHQLKMIVWSIIDQWLGQNVLPQRAGSHTGFVILERMYHGDCLKRE
ncbi:uncharacterized protein MELLADRAFT_68200 [Melampsora larici-populina 98AG31]|uniref:Secreted protein n=1 Tax=Melampsora larici-populina (strain 98AG31 / pathotype 3-4-7) TaxID=747676 RepID=F4S5Y1_MELLP|nr:uncharacterized protein MELLADRAFT_68200 [Melampsora larici-populina 98AG31]EGF99989.1 hypothetical protein MELLADRAFT_68200 [Melampsora larici-populina 98AG31]